MVSFSKPIWSSPVETLPAKQKHSLNSKLASEDNVHQDAVKRQKLQTIQQKNNTLTQNSQPSRTSKQQSTTRQASVEEVNDKIYHASHATGIHAGPPKNLKSALVQLELDGSDDKIEYVGWTPVPADDTQGDEEGGEEEALEKPEEQEELLQEETDEQELSNLLLSRQVASTADRPNKDGPCCLGQRRQQAKPEATAHQWDQTISSWGWASS